MMDIKAKTAFLAILLSSLYFDVGNGSIRSVTSLSSITDMTAMDSFLYVSADGFVFRIRRENFTNAGVAKMHCLGRHYSLLGKDDTGVLACYNNGSLCGKCSKISTGKECAGLDHISVNISNTLISGYGSGKWVLYSPGQSSQCSKEQRKSLIRLLYENGSIIREIYLKTSIYVPSIKGIFSISADEKMLVSNVRINDTSYISSILIKNPPQFMELRRSVSGVCKSITAIISGIRKDADKYHFFFIDESNKVCLVKGEFQEGCLLGNDFIKYFGSVNRWRITCSIPTKNLQINRVSGLNIENNTQSGIFLGNDNILLIGTSNGTTDKYEYNEEQGNVELRYVYKIAPDNTKVILKETDGTYLYGLLKANEQAAKLFQIGIHDCYDHKDCASCFSGDPFCMWCPLTQSCQPNAKCRNKVQNAAACPTILSTTPSSVIAERVMNVTVEIGNLTENFPDSGKAGCRWYLPDNLIEYTEGRWNDKSITCSTPEIQITSKQLWTRVYFNVLYHESSDIAVPGKVVDKNGTIQVLNCLYFDSCTSCQKMHQVGHWNTTACHYDMASLTCRTSTKIVKERYCPQFNVPPSAHTANGLISDITLKGQNLPTASDLYCRILNVTYRLQVINSRIARCFRIYVHFSTLKKFQENVVIEVFGSVNGKNITIQSSLGEPAVGTVYDCKWIANCAECRYYRFMNYHCYWKERCLTTKKDPQKPDVCGTPEITKMSPVDGPLEGGTLVSFIGRHLGASLEELRNEVQLANTACTPQNVSKSGTSLICRTAATSHPITGIVQIFNTISTTRRFSYKKVSVLSLHPKHCFIDFPFNVTFKIDNFMVGGKRSIGLSPETQTNGYESFSWTQFSTPPKSGEYTVQCPDRPEMRTVCNYSVAVKVDAFEFKFPYPLTMLPFPQIVQQVDNTSIESGGVDVRFKSDFDSYSVRLQLHLERSGIQSEPTNCTWKDKDIYCEVPRRPLVRNRRIRRDSADNSTVWYFVFSSEPNGNVTKSPVHPGWIAFVPDPKLQKTELNLQVKSTLKIDAAEGSNLLRGARAGDYSVILGGYTFEAKKVTVHKELILVDLESFAEDQKGKMLKLEVRIGSNLNFTLGWVTVSHAFSKTVLASILISLVIIGIITFLIVVSVLYWRNKKRFEREKHRFEQDMDKAGVAAAAAARNAFTAMQTSMCEMSLLAGDKELPYRSFEDFVLKCLVPDDGQGIMPAVAFDQAVYNIENQPTRAMVERFDEDILNTKQYLLTMIQTFDRKAKIKEKTLLASAVSIVFINKMDYCLEIIDSLLKNVVTNSLTDKNANLQLLFRRSEYLVEKMFANWLTICLYSHLRESETGRHLYVLYKALHTYINRGPVDCFTHRATNILSEDLLLSEEVEYTTIPITASYEHSTDYVSLEILSHDAISQVKQKILDALHMNQPFSHRPSTDDIQLLWKRQTVSAGSDASASGENGGNVLINRSGYLPLDNANLLFDKKTKQIHSIGYYNVNNALVNAHLVVRERRFVDPSVSGSSPSLLSFNDQISLLDPGENRELWHLAKPMSLEDSTALPKDFLLFHVLKTKEVIQPFVADLFKSIFHVDMLKEPPQCVWHLFRILDDIVQLLPNDRPHNHNTLLHVWKSNTFILRVWINLLKNPHFIFDVDIPPALNASLSTVAQALMDACSLSKKTEANFKTMPINKVIYFRELERFQTWVSQYYELVAKNPNAPSQQDLSIMMQELNRQQNVDADIIYKAKRFLYVYAHRYQDEIARDIDSSPWLYSPGDREIFRSNLDRVMNSDCYEIDVSVV